MPITPDDTPDNPVQRGTHKVFGGSLTFYEHQSLACASPMRFSIFIPNGVTEQSRAPVVYFLSGLTCTEENFSAKSGAYRCAAELGLIIVAPDTSPRVPTLPDDDTGWDFGSGASFYLDATIEPWAQHFQMYTYIVDELPTLIDTHFPTQGSSHRSIMGHSMGGHGALVIGLRNKEKYRSISAFSPIVAPTTSPWGQKAFRGYLGENTAAWNDYDASLLVSAHQHRAPILIDQGDADPFLKKELKPELFANACKEAGQTLSLRMQSGYDHSYYFISTFIAEHLRHHARFL